ncbi:MAG: acetate kinase, partial [Hyphomicrobiaceae bacterium]
IAHMLYHDCGLKGLSGISNDARQLLDSDDPRAALAIDAFCHSCAGKVASLATGIGGIDGLIFTAGIGEHSAPIRANILKRLAWLGAGLDEAANAEGRQIISSKASAFACYVIPTNEELMIAQHALELIRRPT